MLSANLETNAKSHFYISSGLFFFGGDIHIYDYSMEANFCKENIFTK